MYTDVFILWYTSIYKCTYIICVRHRKRHRFYPHSTGGFSNFQIFHSGAAMVGSFEVAAAAVSRVLLVHKSTTHLLSMILTVKYIEHINMFLCFCPENPVINSYNWSRLNVDWGRCASCNVMWYFLELNCHPWVQGNGGSKLKSFLSQVVSEWKLMVNGGSHWTASSDFRVFGISLNMFFFNVGSFPLTPSKWNVKFHRDLPLQMWQCNGMVNVGIFREIFIPGTSQN